jgi:predicted esterase
MKTIPFIISAVAIWTAAGIALPADAPKSDEVQTESPKTDAQKTAPSAEGGEPVLTAEVKAEQTRKRLRDLMSNRGSTAVANRVEMGTLITAKAYFSSAEQYRTKDPTHAKRMDALVDQILGAAERGEDPIARQREFFWRGYNTRFAPNPELYSIYVPKSYDDSKKWPLIVSLHGGSSNHNVWMAGLLGIELSVPEYRPNFRTPFRALVHEDEAIIVSPQGLGQNHWMGEAQQDVFDVIEDVRAHYNIDDDKIFLNGLSNGAVASYKIGLGNAWRFAAVIPMSGIVDWTTHAAGAAPDPAEMLVLKNESALTIAENAFNTQCIFYHGVKDSGFNISQARGFAAKLKELGVSFVYNEIPNLGHHLTHLVWRDMRVLKFVRSITRPASVSDVHLVATSERAARQFWVVLNDRLNHLSPGRIHAVAKADGTITVETENTARFTLILSEAPIQTFPNIVINGTAVRLGPYSAQDRITFNASMGNNGCISSWEPWDGRTLERKRAFLSGPLGDVAWEPQVHVYGTLVKEDEETLKNAAILGARSWTRDPEFTQVRHPVIPDTALTPELMRDRAMVLYGNAKNNAVLKEIGDKLPIQVGEDYIQLRDKKLTGKDIGARFICPNPLRPDRYLVVQAGLSAETVSRGGNLPTFLPDYVVFDGRFRDPVQRMVMIHQDAVELGFFSEDWRLPPISE